MSSTPTAWKMDGLELSPQEKLNWLYAKCAELQEEIEQAGGSTVSVTADYTEQTYNNKLATITVDETATKIYAPKVSAAPAYDFTQPGSISIGSVSIGSQTKTFYAPISFWCMETEEEGTTYLSATYTDLASIMNLCTAILTYGDEDETNFVYLEKLWYVTENAGTENETTTYYAKFGSKTYSAETDYDSMTLVTT